MAALIIQKLNPRNRVMQTYTFDTIPISIGRGYDNDLILTDAYVCAVHATIHRTQTGWRIEDHGSKNGIYLRNRKTMVAGSAPLTSGDIVMLGRTRLRVVSADHPVPESKKLQIAKQPRNRYQVPLIAWSLTLTCVLTIAWDFYLDIGDKNLTEELFQAITVIMIILGLVFVWAAGWSFVGRVLKNRADFHYHLLLAASGLIGIELFLYANTFIGYNTCNAALRELIGTMSPILIVGAVVALSIRAATRLPGMQIHLISAFIVLLFASVLTFALINSRNNFSSSPEFDAVLYTPWAQVAKSESIDQFMEANERLFQDWDNQPTEKSDTDRPDQRFPIVH
jgi:pSer/pThr/pTyr-binding forkhead associated (FHA) protein